jgi:uncharacterized membrane protein
MSKTWAFANYILQAVGLFVGITWLVAIVISYVARGDAIGTCLESHYRWQIRTFWFGLLWGLPIAILAISVVGLVVAVPLGIVLDVWLLYRVIKGLKRLSEDKPVYVT